MSKDKSKAMVNIDAGGCLLVFQCLLILLKLVGLIEESWLWVLVPLWILPAIMFGLIGLCLAVMAVVLPILGIILFGLWLYDQVLG